MVHNKIYSSTKKVHDEAQDLAVQHAVHGAGQNLCRTRSSSTTRSTWMVQDKIY